MSLPSSPMSAGRRSTNRRSTKRAKRVFLPWQWLVIGVLALILCISLISLLRANGSLHSMKTQLKKQELAYQQEVMQHQVKYQDWIRYYAAENDIDPAFVAAIIKRESDYDPQAVSRVNAKGLMQIMDSTGAWLAEKVHLYDFNADMLFEPEISIRLGCWYLGYLSRMFNGNPVVVACAYHAGQSNVRSWLEKYSSDGATLTVDEIPMDDTKYYARKVLNAYAIYQQHYY